MQSEINQIVEIMERLGIRSITNHLDCVEVVMADADADESKEETNSMNSLDIDNLGCPPGCTSPFCSCPGTD